MSEEYKPPIAAERIEKISNTVTDGATTIAKNFRDSSKDIIALNTWLRRNDDKHDEEEYLIKYQKYNRLLLLHDPLKLKVIVTSINSIAKTIKETTPVEKELDFQPIFNFGDSFSGRK